MAISRPGGPVLIAFSAIWKEIPKFASSLFVRVAQREMFRETVYFGNDRDNDLAYPLLGCTRK